jgi:hypothetical protein
MEISPVYKEKMLSSPEEADLVVAETALSKAQSFRDTLGVFTMDQPHDPNFLNNQLLNLEKWQADIEGINHDENSFTIPLGAIKDLCNKIRIEIARIETAEKEKNLEIIQNSIWCILTSLSQNNGNLAQIINNRYQRYNMAVERIKPMEAKRVHIDEDRRNALKKKILENYIKIII